MKRELSEAQMRQRREAAKLGGRPLSSHGIRAARRAIARARELGEAAQVEAARNLIAGMKGLLPSDTAAQIIACSTQVLTRWGNPPRYDVKEIGDKQPVPIVFNLGDVAFPKRKGDGRPRGD